MKMIFSLYQKNNTKTFQTHNNIKLEATRLFLIRNNDNNLTELKFIEDELYFEDSLLLDNILTYKIDTIDSLSTIDICIYEDKICQVWKIK